MTRRRTPPRRAGALAALLLAVLAVGCGGGSEEASRVTRTDSAGVEIVESAGEGWSPGSAWELADVPAVEIGGAAGPEDERLFRVRDAARLSDGRFVVLNAGSQELRIFGAGGSHLRSVGSEGEGPGEFRSLARMAVSGDTIHAFDRSARRVSVFLADGTLVRTFTLERPRERAFPSYVGRLPDGSIAARATDFSDGLEGSETQVVRRPALFFVHGPDGAPRDSLASFPGQRRLVRRSGNAIQIRTLPFEPRPVAAVGEDRIYLGDGREHAIDVRSADGRLLRSLRVDREPEPVTDDLREAYVRDRLDRTEDEGARRSLRELYGEMPFAERVPAYTDLLVDEVGNLWVEEPTLPGDSARTWTVFDTAGTLLGPVAMPPRFALMAAGEDWVLGRREDELGVERVELIPLEKPGR